MEHRINPTSRPPSPVGGERGSEEQGTANGKLVGMTVQHASPQVGPLVATKGQQALAAVEPAAVPLLERTSVAPVNGSSTSASELAQPSTVRRIKREFAQHDEFESASNQGITRSIAAQAGTSIASVSKVADDDPITEQFKSSIKRAKLTPPQATQPSEFDGFITGGAFPTLSESEKAEFSQQTRVFLELVHKLRSDFAEYHLAAFPFVPIGTQHLTYLVPAENLGKYHRIARLWLKLRQAVSKGDCREATKARDQLTAYILDPQGLKKSAVEVKQFREAYVSNFADPGVFERILDAKLDYFIEAQDDEQKRQRVGFTLLYISDNLRPAIYRLADMNRLPDKEWHEGNNPRLIFQAGNSRLTIQDENPAKTREAAGHLLQMVSYLLVQNYDQAKVSQQFLLHHRRGSLQFGNTGNTMAALSSLAPDTAAHEPQKTGLTSFALGHPTSAQSTTEHPVTYDGRVAQTQIFSYQ